MRLAMVSLGRMGANMVRRLIRNGHKCVVFDVPANAVTELVKEKVRWNLRIGWEKIYWNLWTS